jgi:hypothetical protein
MNRVTFDQKCDLLSRNLPDVAARINKTGGANALGSIHGTIQELDTTLNQPGTHGIHIIGINRKHKAMTRFAAGYGCRFNKFWRGCGFEKIYQRVAELKYS